MEKIVWCLDSGRGVLSKEVASIKGGWPRLRWSKFVFRPLFVCLVYFLMPENPRHFEIHNRGRCYRNLGSTRVKQSGIYLNVSDSCSKHEAEISVHTFFSGRAVSLMLFASGKLSILGSTES